MARVAASRIRADRERVLLHMQSLTADRRVEVTNPRHLHLAYADALRASAIFVVVLHHLVYLTRPAIGHHRPYEFGYLGVWGVNCFFVLSGYLLGRPYVAVLLDPMRRFPSSKLFYARRFLRIYPLYAVALVFSIVAVYLTYRTLPSFKDAAAHFLLLQTFDAQFATSLNGPLWTMSVDAEFYAVLPLVAWLFARLLRGRTAPQRQRLVFAALATVFVACIGFHYYVLAHYPQTVHDFALAVVLIRNLIGFAGTFALGLLLATIALVNKDRMPQRPVLFGSLVIIGFLIAVMQLISRFDPGVGAPTTMQLVRVSTSEALAAISVALIFFGLSEGRLPFVTRLTGSKIVTSAAALSYAIYLIHWPVIDAVTAILHQPHGLGAFFEVSAASVIPVVGVAYVLHVYVERPVLALKDGMREPEKKIIEPA